MKKAIITAFALIGFFRGELVAETVVGQRIGESLGTLTGHVIHKRRNGSFVVKGEFKSADGRYAIGPKFLVREAPDNFRFSPVEKVALLVFHQEGAPMKVEATNGKAEAVAEVRFVRDNTPPRIEPRPPLPDPGSSIKWIDRHQGLGPRVVYEGVVLVNFKSGPMLLNAIHYLHAYDRSGPPSRVVLWNPPAMLRVGPGQGVKFYARRCGMADTGQAWLPAVFFVSFEEVQKEQTLQPSRLRSKK